MKKSNNFLQSLYENIRSYLVWLINTQIIIMLFSVSSALATSDSCEYTGSPTPAKGSILFDRVRVLAMNVWGQYDDNESKCLARLEFIGEKIANTYPPYNIIGMTEVHPNYSIASTCDGERLVKALQINGEYKGNKARWGHPETRFDHYDGGTSLFATSEFPWKPYSEHVERYNPKVRRRTAHGFVHSRISITDKLKIDVYVTHIYSDGGFWGVGNCDQQCRYRGLEKLAKAIHKYSANSGFPVLVMGDFNIGGPNPSSQEAECLGNSGYGDIMEVLRNPRDLWIEAHPNQKGSTSGFSLSKKPFRKGSLRSEGERIDYIFVMTDSYFTNSPYELIIKDSENSVELTNWTIPSYRLKLGNSSSTVFKEGPFPVSDHKGIDITLEIREKLDWGTILAIIN